MKNKHHTYWEWGLLLFGVIIGLLVGFQLGRVSSDRPMIKISNFIKSFKSTPQRTPTAIDKEKGSLDEQKPRECAHDDKNLRCVKYVSNLEGNIARFDVKEIHPLLGSNLLVRIRGIAIPRAKSKKKCEQVRAALTKRVAISFLSKAERINLEDVEKRRSGILVAKIMADGQSMADMLVKKGLALRVTGKKTGTISWCD